MTRTETAKIKRTVAAYNMIPNVVWSLICFTPVSVFCYSFMNAGLFAIFLTASMISIFLPKSFFHSLQFGKTESFYKKTGVVFLNKFTQNGEIINALIRRKYPAYKILSKKNFSIQKLLQQTYLFEKFHFLMLIFFTFTTGYALFQKQYGWAFIMMVTNVIYNFYPILLQHYIRLRIIQFFKQKEISVQKTSGEILERRLYRKHI
ncbi:MAG: hypothetical protein ACTHK0_00845 [Ginsengibacter sp.]